VGDAEDRKKVHNPPEETHMEKKQTPEVIRMESG
jgi:hypothetical protein